MIYYNATISTNEALERPLFEAPAEAQGSAKAVPALFGGVLLGFFRCLGFRGLGFRGLGLRYRGSGICGCFALVWAWGFGSEGAYDFAD